MTQQIHIKRAYDPPAKSDGYRVLVDRVWPRGVRKEDLQLDEWAKELAPSTKLRQWFGHDPERWDEFRKRYESELKDSESKAEMKRVLDAAKGGRTLTLVYGAKDEEHNQAVVLSKLLKQAGARRVRDK
jgi:uncharacterized protein YeaO (DUF488 family)